MVFKGAIFDFDGVVVDSAPLHYNAWRKVLFEDYKFNFDKVIYETKVSGRKSSEVLSELLPHLDEIEIARALDLKQKYYHEQISSGCLQTYSSTIALIKELLAHKVKIGVASSSRSVGHVLKLFDITQLFHTVVSGHDTTKGKPHPESFLTAAGKLGLEVSECVVFEDAKVGVKAAKSGGFLCVGIDRNHKPEYYELADLCVHDLSEMNYDKLSKLFIDKGSHKEGKHEAR